MLELLVDFVVDGVLASPCDANERENDGINKRQFSTINNISSMHKKICHQHGEDDRHHSESCDQSDKYQQGTEHLGEDYE